MSPTIATRQPSSDGPRCRRSVNASSSACVGCSWQPSPALTTRAERPRRDPVRRARGRMAHDDRVDTHRVDRLHGVEQALALLDRRRRRPRRSSCRPRAAWPQSRTRGACAWSPRRTATRRSCPAAPGPSGCRAGSPRGTSRSGRASTRSPPVRPGRRPRAGASRVSPLLSFAARPRGRRRRRRRPRRAGPVRLRSTASEGSCRRSRPATAARGDRGRRAPRVARPAAARARAARRARPARCGR